MKLQTQLVAAFVAVALFGVGATVMLADRYLEAQVRRELTVELQRTSAVFAGLQEERLARRRAEAHVVAEEPRLKALIRTQEVDAETLADVAQEIRSAARADLFTLTDRMGRTLVDVSKPSLPVERHSDPALAEALRNGEASAIWKLEGNLYEVTLRALRFGADVSGLLITGYQVNDAQLAGASQRTGASVAVLVGGEVVGQSTDEALRLALPELRNSPAGISEQKVEGAGSFLVFRGPYPNAKEDAELMLFRSVDEMLGNHRDVRRNLILFGVLAIVLAAVVGGGIARRMSGRVRRLVDGTMQLSIGNLAARVPEEGNDEVSQLSRSFNDMAGEIDRSRHVLRERERLAKELEIARNLQMGLLPAGQDLPGYRMAAEMIPAEEVGGDFYDVQRQPDGLLMVAIGDVSSHGLIPGLIMMMAQSALAALASRRPLETPGRLVQQLNRVLYKNIRDRLGKDDYMTLTVLCEQAPGQFRYAGAHLPILVWRKATGKVEYFKTPGPWVGLVPELGDSLPETSLKLEPGDRLILYTDGITEARNAQRDMFEVNRMVEVIESPGLDIATIRDRILENVRKHMSRQEDDLTLLILERTV